jgi:hypothetical protein
LALLPENSDLATRQSLFAVRFFFPTRQFADFTNCRFFLPLPI